MCVFMYKYVLVPNSPPEIFRKFLNSQILRPSFIFNQVFKEF